MNNVESTREIDERNVPLAFEAQFVALFEAHHHRLLRVLDRLSGDADVASDLAQEAFVRLYRRGAVPETPGAWLISVAMNLFRNARSSRSRHLRLLTVTRAEGALSLLRFYGS